MSLLLIKKETFFLGVLGGVEVFLSACLLRLLPSTTATPLLPGTRLEASTATLFGRMFSKHWRRRRCMPSKDEDGKDKDK